MNARDPSRPGAQWRTLAMLYLAGGILALLTVALPHDARLNEPALLALATTACATSAALKLYADRLPSGLLPWVLAFGTAIVTAGIATNGTASSPYNVFYVWIAVEAAFFLERRQAMLQVALCAIGYAGALALVSGPDGGGRWLLGVGTALVAAVLVAHLRDGMRKLIDDLAGAARTDMLTGLVNRRGFQELLAREVDRAARSGRPFAVVSADLDHFKAINDRDGHLAGDRALQRFAAVALDVARSGDAVARIGGEEFALLVPECDEHAAYLVAERLRHELRARAGIASSFGIAAYPKHAASADSLVDAADQALYAAKRLGRDRSVIFNAAIVAELAGDASRSDQRAGDQLAAVLLLAETLDVRDAATANHSRTVAALSRAIAQELGLPPERVERIRLAGALHDIGKIGVADDVLEKPGALTPAEEAEMRKHCELGARMLHSANLPDIGGWVLAHHERPDGTGYPAGLRGDQIPLESRILAVADAYEAMTANRPYHRAMEAAGARSELEQNAGTQFDARVVDAFLSLLDRGVPAVTAGGRTPSPADPAR